MSTLLVKISGIQIVAEGINDNTKLRDRVESLAKNLGLQFMYCYNPRYNMVWIGNMKNRIAEHDLEVWDANSKIGLKNPEKLGRKKAEKIIKKIKKILPNADMEYIKKGEYLSSDYFLNFGEY